ncbi:Succinylglutamate desuccinylase / Aspartoacylase family protein [Polystyrenella longa]|uniref:Succinylglutamate desuccinylase / Aspartoacylase family protein n=1 Tax=Polystyrenella longa TaxID=2528007 RepID=A0A518CPG9_9PLAN|nr:succinylglutamate desuccinylase/aspartoacylase family protein [Polystyrenella longa]QDU81120.1 Succinylglutamate desuccinylase / Aspartoacylase family protein [Polystyrenella longa]
MSLSKIEITGQHEGPHLLITGGVHGDEFEPMVAIQRLETYLSTRTTGLHGRVTLIPIVNEAAFARGSRTADDEKDLARTCPGNAEGTITEQIADQLTAEIRQADCYMDLHTGGTRIAVYPLTGYMLHTDPKVLETSRRMAQAFGLPVVWGTTPNLDGRSLSIAREVPIPAIYTEYLGGGTCSPRGVRAYIQGCLNVLHELQLLEGDAPRLDPGTSREFVQLTIEDDREQAGHMQINHPASRAGLWTPEVELGSYVEKGERLGTIASADGKQQSEVVANQTGLVLVLRTFCYVAQEEFLAVILEPPTEEAGSMMQQISKHQPLFMHSVSLNQLLDCN